MTLRSTQYKSGNQKDVPLYAYVAYISSVISYVQQDQRKAGTKRAARPQQHFWDCRWLADSEGQSCFCRTVHNIARSSKHRT